MQVDVRVIQLGKLHVAATNLGGFVIRGRSAPEPADAIRNLFWKLAGQDGDDDSKLAVEFAAQGTSLTAELEQLGDGK